MVFRSRRQSRLTVATIFLYLRRKLSFLYTKRTKYLLWEEQIARMGQGDLLQGRNNAADPGSTWCIRWRSWNYSIRVGSRCVLTLHWSTVHVLLAVELWSEGVGAAWERERSRTSESLCLGCCLWVRIESIHIVRDVVGQGSSRNERLLCWRLVIGLIGESGGRV